MGRKAMAPCRTREQQSTEELCALPMTDPTITATEPAPGALPHWLRLADLPFSSKLIAALLEAFDNDPAALFEASDTELDSIPIFQTRHLVTLRKPEHEATDRQLRWFERYGVRLLLPSHPEYPQALRTIPDPPPFLFIRGSLAEAKNNGVGIVGSRYATPYGRGVSERFGRELAGAGRDGGERRRTEAPWLPAGGRWQCWAAGWMWTTRKRTGSFS